MSYLTATGKVNGPQKYHTRQIVLLLYIGEVVRISVGAKFLMCFNIKQIF